MAAVGFATFDTALGLCAVAWNADGIVGVWLPEASPEVLVRRVRHRHPDAAESLPPAAVAAAIAAMTALLAGEEVDLRDVTLDLSAVPEVHRRIYAVARDLPPGVTRTYGELARAAGLPGGAQVVGQAMGANPCPIVVPCHRVVAAGGGNGGFSAPGGVDTKLRLLAIEGATLF